MAIQLQKCERGWKKIKRSGLRLLFFAEHVLHVPVVMGVFAFVIVSYQFCILHVGPVRVSLSEKSMLPTVHFPFPTGSTKSATSRNKKTFVVLF